MDRHKLRQTTETCRMLKIDEPSFTKRDESKKAHLHEYVDSQLNIWTWGGGGGRKMRETHCHAQNVEYQYGICINTIREKNL